MSKLTKAQASLLANIVVATEGENGCLYIPESKEAKKLVADGYIEVNLEMTNDDGAAARATASGLDYVNGTSEGEEATAEVETQSSFELDTDVPLPSIRRGGRGAEKYPFEQMEVGHSFHVAATEDKPTPAKSLASTVSSATARYRVEDESGATKQDKDGNEVPVMVDTRKFVVRAVGEDDPKGPGARVFRIQ